jgi:beta-glucosidase
MSPLFLLVFALLAAGARAGSNWPPSAHASAKATLAKMNLTQKLTMVVGWAGPYVGDTPAIVLDDGTVIPAIHEHDGPQGVANKNYDVTCWPAALTVAQSWDPAMSYAFGASMGREQYLKGTNVMLGPGVNLARVPWNGRNFEYMGEDPWLASAMAAAEIAGVSLARPPAKKPQHAPKMSPQARTLTPNPKRCTKP